MRRQWMGNLVPFGMALLCALIAYPLGIYIQVIVGIVVAWCGVSQWGFFENTKIDKELRELSGSEGELVGFVFKLPPTLLDAHAELGLLTLDENDLKFVTEDQSYTISRKDTAGIGTQLNIHSILGLGGWIMLKLVDGSVFRLESRRFATMLQSRKRTKILFSELKTWIHEKAPA